MRVDPEIVYMAPDGDCDPTSPSFPQLLRKELRVENFSLPYPSLCPHVNSL